MEVVGGVASIITLIEATGVLAEVSKNLVLRWKNAPHEIRALATRLSLLAAELQSIKNATARSHPVLTNAIIRQSLSDLLTDVRKRLAKLESLYFRLEQHGPLRQKFQWTVKDAGSAEKMLNKTQEIEQRLANLMTLISLRAQTPILEGLERIEQMVSALAPVPPAAGPVAVATSSKDAADSHSSTPYRSPSGLATKRTLITSLWTTSKGWQNWGFRGGLAISEQDYHTDYNIVFSISLPLTRILGSYAVTGSLSLRSTPLYRSSFTFRHPSYFAVARVVEYNHPFMMACRNGDIENVKFMLRSGEGRPTDVTEEGDTPMLFASQAGSIEVVAELLECGVEVDGTVEPATMFTMLEISSQEKHLDLVRFLLHRGASADHVSALGCGASSLCWYASDLTSKHSSLDISNVLSESTHIDLRRDDNGLAVAVDLAALHGCGSQIDYLVSIGYDICQYAFQPRHTLGFAVNRGNYPTYSALVSHFGANIFANDTEIFAHLLKVTIFGRNLHIEQYPHWTGEHDEILRDLLRRCGDDRLLPLPLHRATDPILPTRLCKEMTAIELAAALGPETEAWYLGMVRSCGFLSEDEEDEVMQRLRKLSSEGHVATGFVEESEGESDDSGGVRGGGSEDRSENSTFAEEEILENSNTDVDGGHETDSGSEADEAEQFWDAPESV